MGKNLPARGLPDTLAEATPSKGVGQENPRMGQRQGAEGMLTYLGSVAWKMVGVGELLKVQ